ncbi:MAG: 16S rRNA (adenine(1518)-N(6)/adenine(1519)-N(6))-dimethyltransferase RsmA [Pseudomonadota bacterium]
MNNPVELPPLRDVIAAHGLDARKSLGQHFLLDMNITRKIARLANASPEDVVIEIGPGPGGLTRALLETGARVIAVERDDRCLALLGELSDAYGRLEIEAGDALDYDIAKASNGEGGAVKIVSNLPYNISTELLVRWLRANADRARPAWRSMALMFQKEVADRILAAPGSKTYGRLSIVAQAASQPHRGFDLPARAFTPPPKVDSTVITFEPAPIDFDFAALERITQAAFSQRRKMLRSSLKPVFGPRTEDVLAAVAVPPDARAEAVSVDRFIALSKALEDAA